MRFYSMTDTGKMRSQNQDYLYASNEPIGRLPNLFIVADGMGGHNAGDYASCHAVEIVLEEIRNCDKTQPIAILEQAITHANTILYETAAADINKAGMGTTLVAATLMEDRLYVANVGDSRLYIVDKTSICQITRDHSLVQELMRSGKMGNFDVKHHPKRNAITRAVGTENKIRIDFFEVARSNFDRIVMCTDGLTNMVSDEEIFAEVLRDKTPREKVETLIAKANENGGEDNISVIIVETNSDEV